MAVFELGINFEILNYLTILSRYSNYRGLTILLKYKDLETREIIDFKKNNQTAKVTLYKYCEEPIETTIKGFMYEIEYLRMKKKIALGVSYYDARIGEKIYEKNPTENQCLKFGFQYQDQLLIEKYQSQVKKLAIINKNKRKGKPRKERNRKKKERDTQGKGAIGKLIAPKCCTRCCTRCQTKFLRSKKCCDKCAFRCEKKKIKEWTTKNLLEEKLKSYGLGDYITKNQGNVVQ